MLNPKSKRSPSSARHSRFADEDATREDSIWSGPHSVSPPIGDINNDLPRVRMLRTSDTRPTAPKLQDFFPRETRPVGRWLVFWDPGRTWPKQALADLVNEGEPGPKATRLAHADNEQTFALVHHLLVEAADGRCYGLLHIEADPKDDASADVALMMLERSDHAIVLTGHSSEYREVPRRLQQFCGQAAWRGPTLQFVTPQDKPSRADRLRKVSWPRSINVRVVEARGDAGHGWLAPLLDRLTDSTLFSRPAVDPRPVEPAAPDLPLPAPFTEAALAELPPRPPIAACAAAVEIVALVPAATAVAVLDACSHAVLASAGDSEPVASATRIALQLWGARATETAPSLPTEELAWRGAGPQHLALPLPAHPGLLLVLALDPAEADFDLRQARWQLAVASRTLGG